VTTKHLLRGLLGATAATLVATVTAVSGAGATTGGASPTGGGAQSPFGGTSQSVCASAPVGYAGCLARVLTPGAEQSHLSSFTRDARFGRNSGAGRSGSSAVTVSGLSPTNIKSVYGFTTSSSAGTGMTIAVVDAYDDPTAAADLSTFSSQWGLPACTTSNGCFTKVNENGGTTLPAANSSWALEISLDIEWAHAVAPGAKILLVEANSNSDSDLFTADHYAGQHANYVSDSWGGPEFAGETADDLDLTGASYFAAAGDAASAVYYPATSPDVTAVGGTSLAFNSNGTLASESAWSSGGGGCSAYELASSAQVSEDAQAGCGLKRAVPDVALDADPNSGVAVYDSTAYDGSSGWWTVGGTSVSTPIWAAESAATAYVPTQPNLYSSNPTPRLKDITSGSNGHPTLVGYDLATGLGSWANGVPSAPGTLTATGATGGITLNWGAASGATSYEVYRGTSATSISTSPVASVSGTTYDDTSVTNGTTYYYEVEGLDSSGQGIPSNRASASPGSSSPSAPSPPTNLKATGGTSSIALSWTASAGASSYDVLRSTTSGAETLYASGVTSTTYTDTNVTSGPTYYYTVEAVGSGLTSGPSGQAAASTTGAPPGAPALSATVSGVSVVLSWGSVSGASSYEVLRGTSVASLSIYAITTATGYTDTQVSDGTTYSYEVEAVNTAGLVGPPSNEVSETISSVIKASISKSCSGASCTFTSTSTDAGGTITTYLWTTSGASASTSTFRHTFTSAGTYVVNLAVSDNKGSTGNASVSVSCTTQSRGRGSSALTCT
jgi:subtilase family serine protease